jgi:hypothetical protein
MRLKQTGKKITLVGLTIGVLFTSLIISAQEIVNANDGTYISVPMHIFNKLTGKEKNKGQEFYTYQDGKLTKCPTDLSEQIKKECKKNIDKKELKHHKDRFNKKREGMRRDHKFVLLTVEQIENLKKEKLELKLKNIEEGNDCLKVAVEKASENAVTVKVDGKDVKVVSMRKCMNIKHQTSRTFENPAQG